MIVTPPSANPHAGHRPISAATTPSKSAAATSSLLAAASSGGNIQSSDLKYLENFSSPYVKIVLLCKECSKEMPMKSGPSSWKRHYLTHASEADRPHKCAVCGKGFIENNKLKLHELKHR